MSRRSILAKRAAEAPKAAPPTLAPVDWRLEAQRLNAANARLQLRVAELERDLVKAHAARPVAVAASKLDKADAKVAAARAIASAAETSLARTAADAIPAAKPKAARAKKADAPKPARAPRKSVRKGAARG